MKLTLIYSTSVDPTTAVLVDTATSTTGVQLSGGSQDIADTTMVGPTIVEPSLSANITSPEPPRRMRKERVPPSAKVRNESAEKLTSRQRNRNRTGLANLTTPNCSRSIAPTSSTRGWFEKAKDQFRSEDLGDVWSRLLEQWEAFQEEENTFDDSRVLSAKRRPESIAMWIGRARLPTFRPTNPNAKADEEHFKAWWKGLQPAWRVVDGKVVSKSMSGDWSSLRLPGINGVQSIVAGLFFWGLSASPKVRTRKAWTVAVEECTEVFEQLRLPARTPT
ncbi:hypothetical protein NLJ89_g4476 [Agrocybe chaxingu]|uniref:Uncharacterized protein n=1 Tax=Agrocybe chaxingu TaxID=84603 RepID=A0A9W8K403_9AGAR|nr:hypothetical protein NLJ89_g4476 [Agrocybe chaxingu]